MSGSGLSPRGSRSCPRPCGCASCELLTAIRRHEGTRHWIETYRSLDDGQSWSWTRFPHPDLGEGNPASLIRLKDGRLCLTYGHRARPFSIRARLSRDGGRTWEPEIILRGDGGGRDLGYPRSVQRPDGRSSRSTTSGIVKRAGAIHRRHDLGPELARAQPPVTLAQGAGSCSPAGPVSGTSSSLRSRRELTRSSS